MSVNKAILVGRLGKDPDLRYTPGGQAVTSFSLATNRYWKNKEGEKQEATTWHNIVAWGKQAETMKEYLSKGKQIFIEGRIDNRSYDDKEGNKRYISEVVVENFRFLDSRESGESAVGAPASGSSEPASPPEGDTPQGGSPGDDDLPF